MDHETYAEWLQLDFDGELSPERRALLEQHLRECAACEQERSSLAMLREALDASAPLVRPDFRSAVMSSLPAAGWEARNARAWALPAAMIALLGVGAGVVSANGGVSSGGALAGAFRSLFDLFSTALLAGGGLLQASWRGVGLALGSLFSGSWASLAALGVVVVCLNVLFFRLLRRDRTADALALRRRLR